MRALGRNPLWSGHSFRLNPYSKKFDKLRMSQSSLVEAFVPAKRSAGSCGWGRRSQSPLVGAFVPAQKLR